ncbi:MULTISPECIES: alpha/beta hydrolase [Niastella]|uniref:Alpha/beta hydrolase n=1 Tax=Niastella soli TaxID=2821487 RepID=A0ABS3YMP5_9BACT|nr:alpha/beta hydrolase [Niastella soli]MBO9198715.1 alpha/beta hydrolase [Niastella soli]
MKYTSLIFAGLMACLTLHAQDEAPKKVDYPTGYTAQIDVVYTQGPGWQQKMDLYLAPKEKGPVPLVINIHGGGWNHGTKESQTGFNSFFKAGFAVANIEYRLTPQATAPAAVEDARCALIYIVKNAAALNVDVNRIVVMGGSAGGHLALMAGLLGNDHRFDGNCPGVENIKVAAIIDKYGITDVNDWAYGTNITSKSATKWLGDKSKDEAFIKSVSPMSYVNKNSPPVFIVHGDADPTVPYQQSVDLHKKLSAAGVETVFITVPEGKHGQFPKEKNSEVNKAIMVFLKELQIIK